MRAHRLLAATAEFYLTVLAFFALVVLATLRPARSHVGDRVYPIYELTDEMVERIDVKDGWVDEWMEREPTLTLLDFGLFPEASDISQPNPADLDFRIWLGWTRSPSRIYVAAIVADDVYKNDYDPEDPHGLSMLANDSVTFFIDADHSGGPYSIIDYPGADAETKIKASNVQWYHALSEAPGDGNLEIASIDNRGWPVRPPFGDGGGSVQGENPVFWVTEFYLTPFAHFEYEDQQASARYDLVPGEIVGFQLGVVDYDAAGNEHRAHHTLPLEVQEFGSTPYSAADWFVDGLLVGIQDESVVRASSWARIKASLAE